MSAPRKCNLCWLMALVRTLMVASCTAQAVTPAATSDPVQAAARTVTAAATATDEASSPTPGEVPPEPTSPVALPDDISTLFPMAWPIDAFTDEQIQAAAACREAADEAENDPPQTACDWALLALELSPESDDGQDPQTFTASGMPGEEAIDAYLRAVALNPAMALTMPRYPEGPPVYGGLDGSPVLVAAPRWDSPVTTVQIDFAETSIQYQTRASVTVSDAETNPRVEGTITQADYVAETETSRPVFGAPSVNDLQNLTAALSDLIPIDDPVYAAPGISYALNWDVTLTLGDGRVLTVTTNRSLVHGAGGPWQVEIDGQIYLQVSNALMETLRPILLAMNWPYTFDDVQIRSYYVGDIPPLVSLAFP